MRRVASCRPEGFVRWGHRIPEGARMSTEENKAVARRWSEKLWDRGELSVAAADRGDASIPGLSDVLWVGTKGRVRE